ncbi:uncharacterized protein (TIGR04141 family) [Nocardia tenerifensis]|uniref:Uncharacterized protein (TIGR04141 family) n=1 Tax=Nocardia tenerifensis TaxID=228006 RepID=A0A318K9W6_9NOCA|nr:DUF6119 family protein [Nocardia tenerifensis]PXX68522.1 uncharacterized protein (TIGR04141 family) [Nocardia tenerifensis]
MARTKQPPTTHKASLYRIRTPEGPDLDLHTVLAESYLTRDGFTAAPFDHDGLQGLLATGTIARGRTGWCEVAESLTGLATHEENRTAAGLLLVRTRRFVYALTYGMGHLMIDSARLDSGFGLAFAIRCLDENSITLVRHHLMDARGRTDENTATRGEHIRGFGVERFGDIVSRITGSVLDIPLTYSRDGSRSARITGSDNSIKLPLARTPAELLSDLRAIEDVCERLEPLPGFDLVARVRSLNGRGKTNLVQHLDAKLDEMLADSDAHRVALSAPNECVDYFGFADTFTVSKGAIEETVDELELDHLLAVVRDLPAGSRLKTLKEMRVQMFSDPAAEDPVSRRVAAHRWLTAEVVEAPVHYFYWQGTWYEVGEEYLKAIEDGIQELLDRPTKIVLPPWPKGKDEGWYNEQAAKHPAYTLLDKKTVRTKKFRGGGLEICDLLGPEGQLIHVKKADKSTADLNHLFAQGRVSIETLRYDAQVREKFLALLAKTNSDGVVTNALRAPTVVFAILLKGGKPITVGSLFAFAQVSLLQAATALQGMGATVEIVAIKR